MSITYPRKTTIRGGGMITVHGDKQQSKTQKKYAFSINPWIHYELIKPIQIKPHKKKEVKHMIQHRSHTFQSVHDIFFLECYEYISQTKDEERINTYSYPYEDYTLQYTTEYAGGRYCLEQVDKIQLQYNYETRHLQIRIIYHDSHINHHTINIADIRTLYNINLTPTKYATKE